MCAPTWTRYEPRSRRLAELPGATRATSRSLRPASTSPARIFLLADAGIVLVGENRAQSLQRRCRPRRPVHLGLHRRAAKQTRARDPPARAPDPLAGKRLGAGRARAPRRPGAPGAAGAGRGQPRRRSRKGRHHSGATRRFHRTLALPGGGPDDDAAVGQGPRAEQALVSPLRELAEARGLEQLSMGTTQDFGVAVEEGATIVRIGTRLYA